MNLIAILIFCLAFAFASDDTSAIHSKPNVVLFLIDDLGYGDLGCFGNKTSRTPNVDEMANGGIKFRQWISGSCICTPSRASLLTGRYASRSGMESDDKNFRTFNSAAQPGGLPLEELSIASVLKQANYSTALIGKWHLGVNDESNSDGKFLPASHGFDLFYGMPVTNVQSCGKKKVFHQSNSFFFFLNRAGIGFGIALFTVGIAYFQWWIGMKTFILLSSLIVASFAYGYHYTINYTLLSPFSCLLYRNTKIIEQPVLLDSMTQKLVLESKEFIDQNKENPFFLFFADIKVHTALFTGDEFRNRSGKGEFVDNMEEMDWGVGEIIHHLEKLKLLENTILFFTSDNGPFLEEGHEAGTTGFVRNSQGELKPLRAGKGQNFEGGIRVPGIVSWKGKIEPRISDQFVSSLDILPTVSRLAGIQLPKDRIFDGNDLSPLLISEKSKPVDIKSDAHEFFFHYCGLSVSAIRHHQFKMHFSTGLEEPKEITEPLANCNQCCPNGIICACSGIVHDPPLLFNLIDDPGERNPLNVSNHLQLVNRMKSALEEHRKTFKEVPKSKIEAFARPWLMPCCNPPHCTCIKEGDQDRISKHKSYWSDLY